MWGKVEIEKCQREQKYKRSYAEDVEIKILKLSNKFSLNNYGSILYDEKKYELYILYSNEMRKSKPNILITGGVHGYETSGVHGALRFLETVSDETLEKFNFIVAPCISPWAYETINRWNYNAIDPNRSFFKNSPALECQLVMNAVNLFDVKFLAHFDLHETTDTDNSVFRPALESRDGIEQELWEIPDGFYVVGDSENQCPAFQNTIIDSVKTVTHIAPSDKSGKIIGEQTTGEGVINYPIKKLHLCTGFSDAQYNTTTEVYPDSPRATDEECILAQVAAINGGLNYLSNNIL